MIKAIVLDIDGVIVGSKPGVNLPHPSLHISQVLKKINDGGVPVSLLSGKASFIVEETVRKIGLDNLHVADGGAVVFNPLHNTVAHEQDIDPHAVASLVQSALKHNVCVSLFTREARYIFASQLRSHAQFFEKYQSIVQVDAHIIHDIQEISSLKVLRILLGSDTVEQKEIIGRILNDVDIPIATSWSGHPRLTPAELLIITKKGVGKRSGFLHLIKSRNVTPEEVLGVGDTVHDWDFMELCGYKGVMENATQGLKEKVDFSQKNTFLGGHVNEDGILKILRHFSLM
jgi:HAD superfamily hydrolase (TIGR01484 family)